VSAVAGYSDVAHCSPGTAQEILADMSDLPASDVTAAPDGRGSQSRLALKNIVYLTDFSRSSEAALPFAKWLARAFGAKVYALHVLVPDVVSYMTPESPSVAWETQDEVASTKMSDIDMQFTGTVHASLVERASSLWAVLDQKMKQFDVGLVVLGTKGRTGFRRFVMGSTAESVLRKSSVPVMVIGPRSAGRKPVNDKVRRILLATDLGEDSEHATAYAISLAQENQAELILLHVIGHRARRIRRRPKELSVAEAIHQLQTKVSVEANLWRRPESLIELGEPGKQIVAAANRCAADLIVLGIRNAEHLFAATHLQSRTAHEVIAHAPCPVLCVPGSEVPAN